MKFRHKTPNLFSRSLLCVMIASLGAVPHPVASAQTGKSPVIEHIELHDVPLAQVLRLLSDEYDINVIASKKASEVPVTMFLNSVTAVDVLETLARTYSLWYKRDEQSNIYRIYTAEEFRLGSVDSNRENVQVFTARYQNVLSIAYAVKNLYPERIKMDMGEEQREIFQDLQARFRRFDLIANRSSLNLNNNSRGGVSNNTAQNTQSNNVLSNQSGNTNNSNIRTAEKTADTLLNNQDLQKNLQPIVSGDLKQNDGQINEFIHEDAPIFLTVLKNQNNILVRTRDPMAIQEIEKLIRELDKPPITVLLEVKVLSVALNDGYNSVFDIALADSNKNLAGSREPITTTTTNKTSNSSGASQTIVTENSSQLSNVVNKASVIGTGIASLAGAEVVGPALLAKVVSDQFEAKLQLLEKEGRVTELATPMVSTANQEVSRINLVNEVPIVRSYSVVAVSGGGTGNVGGNAVARLEPQVSTEQIGTTLIMTPSISKDRSVNMNLLIDRSALSTAPSTIPVENGLGQIVNVAVDTVERRSYAGNVIMKDNVPMAIGGLITERAADTENKVPVLGDIPGVGFFFNNQGRERKRDELIIIVTPHIVENMESGNELSQKILEKNSIHPSAKSHEGLGIYSNDKEEHKDYKLEKPYKNYRNQDQLDRYKWQNKPEATSSSGTLSEPGGRPHISQDVQQIYMQMTRYAAKCARLPKSIWEKVPGIEPITLRKVGVLNLFNNWDAHVLPVASWQRGGITVTALEVRNHGARPIQLDHRHLKGHWLAATLEDSSLAASNEVGDSTYLYLISSQPFEEVELD